MPEFRRLVPLHAGEDRNTVRREGLRDGWQQGGVCGAQDVREDHLGWTDERRQDTGISVEKLDSAHHAVSLRIPGRDRVCLRIYFDPDSPSRAKLHCCNRKNAAATAEIENPLAWLDELLQQRKCCTRRAVLAAAERAFGIEYDSIIESCSFGQPGGYYRKTAEAARTQPMAPSHRPIDWIQLAPNSLRRPVHSSFQLCHQSLG